jgi:hypothetical protein
VSVRKTVRKYRDQLAPGNASIQGNNLIVLESMMMIPGSALVG